MSRCAPALLPDATVRSSRASRLQLLLPSVLPLLFSMSLLLCNSIWRDEFDHALSIVVVREEHPTRGVAHGGWRAWLWDPQSRTQKVERRRLSHNCEKEENPSVIAVLRHPTRPQQQCHVPRGTARLQLAKGNNIPRGNEADDDFPANQQKPPPSSSAGGAGSMRMFGGIPGPSPSSDPNKNNKKSYSMSKWKPGSTLRTATTAGSNNSYLWNMPSSSAAASSSSRTGSTSSSSRKQQKQRSTTSSTNKNNNNEDAGVGSVAAGSSSAGDDDLFPEEDETKKKRTRKMTIRSFRPKSPRKTPRPGNWATTLISFSISAPFSPFCSC